VTDYVSSNQGGVLSVSGDANWTFSTPCNRICKKTAGRL
jgi:hypothetical protein